jgi:hypothetical protein
MNRIVATVATLVFALPLAGMAQPVTQTTTQPTSLSSQELHSLLKSAHSSADYQQLAGYYHQQEAKYRAEAASEKIERDRRAQVNAGLYQKYPRPVDSAQYLYESYLESANQAAAQAQHFDQLAAGQTQHD